MVRSRSAVWTADLDHDVLQARAGGPPAGLAREARRGQLSLRGGRISMVVFGNQRFFVCVLRR
jgi:hypothetical protein